MAEAKIEIVLSNGAKAGETLKELTKQANTLNKEIKDLKPGTEAFEKKSKDLQSVSGRMADIKDQIKGTTQASGALNDAFDKFVPFSGQFKAIGQSIMGAKQSVGGLSSSFGVLRGAIIATGIGALVVAVATLYDWFKKTDEGATLLAGIFRGLGQVTDILFKNVRAFVTAIDFSNPKQMLEDFLGFLKDQVINRLKAFGVIVQGIFELDFKQVADGFIQLGTGITNATDKIAAFSKEVAEAVKEGIALEAELDRIADRARELQVLDAQTKKNVDQLLLQAKNVGLSYEERIALLNKAGQIEQANHKLQLENARALEAAMQREVAEKQKVGKVTDEVDQKLKDAQIARINLEAQSIALQEKIENRRTALNEKRQAEIDKQTENELKAAQNLAQLKLELMDEGIEKEIEKIQLDTEKKIAALVGSEEQILEQKKALLILEQSEIDAIKTAHAQTELERERAYAEEYKRIQQERTMFEMNLQMQRQDNAIAGAQLGADLLGKAIKDEQAAKAIRKTIALVEIGINLQREKAANAVIAAQFAASFFGPAAPAAYLGMLAKLNLQANIRAIISAIKVAAFKKGGYVQGPSHEQGGVPGIVKSTGQPIEFEGGEFFFSRKAVKAIGVRTLTRINDRLTNSFATGGSVGVPSSSSPSIDPAISAENNALLAELRSMKEVLMAWPLRLKVENVVTETRDKIQMINTLQSEADV